MSDIRIPSGEGRENYILPFLWMKGAPHPRIAEEIRAIRDCGIREFCLEARPHPDFAGPAYWEDVSFVLEEAKRQGMRFWILDDDHFPTGHANGAFERKCPEKAKWYLAAPHADILGGKRIRWMYGPLLPEDAQVIAILAARRADGDDADKYTGEVLDAGAESGDGVLLFDLPEGLWRFFVIARTQKGGGLDHYMNLIDPESVQVLIDEVYEPHYAHFAGEFGKTVRGFFSDEPELGNVGEYSYEDLIGVPDIRVPWSLPLERRLKARWGESFAPDLLSLWFAVEEEGSGRTARVRAEYMDELTRLLKESFSGRLASWCEARGVEYLGHIIENRDAFMPCSVGHYYREASPRHMAGVDIIRHQIEPGYTGADYDFSRPTDGDGSYFSFILPKLASSLAHCTAHMRNRALCEVFGDYGWSLDAPTMKYVLDALMVRGINHFVPHAFSVGYPDPDNPPHFYADGFNPQYPLFGHLMRYVNRVCGLMSGEAEGGAVPLVDAAVLHPVETTWIGGKYAPLPKICRWLAEHQTDYDLIPEDYLREAEIAADPGKAMISNGVTRYRTLIIPEGAALPDEAGCFVRRAGEEGVRIICCGDPEELAGQVDSPLRDQFSLTLPAPSLRIMRCALPPEAGASSAVRWYIFNESAEETAETEVLTAGGGRIPLKLLPGESVIFTVRDSPEGPEIRVEEGSLPIGEEYREETLCCEWRVRCVPAGQAAGVTSAAAEAMAAGAAGAGAAVSDAAAAGTAAEGTEIVIPEDSELPEMNFLPGLRRFSGTFVYEGLVRFGAEEGEQVRISLPDCGNGAMIVLNGTYCGAVVTDGGAADVTGAVLPGENRLSVLMPNTLAWVRRDRFSASLSLRSSGLRKQPVISYIRHKNGSTQGI